MSKKTGVWCRQRILLDVKFGEGAFMETSEKAEELANCMISIGKYFHKDVRVIISNMNQPLGNAIGNALEVKEAIATLQGNGPKDFVELCFEAGSIMLLQAKAAFSKEQARAMLKETLQNGKAYEKLVEMVKAQHGDVEQIYHPELLPQAEHVIEITSKEEGYVKELHALQLGLLAMRLGAGRMVKEDVVDPSVGIVLHKKDGDYVQKGESLASVHTKQNLDEDWLKDFYDSFVFSKNKVDEKPLIYKIIEE